MSVLADIRTALHAAVDAAVDVPVYRIAPDDVIDTPCVIFDLATISRSFQNAGGSVVRQSIWVVPFQGGNTSETVPSLDDLVSEVWEALGGGSTLVLQSLGAGSQPQSATASPLSAGGEQLTAMRVDTDVTVNRALC